MPIRKELVSCKKRTKKVVAVRKKKNMSAISNTQNRVRENPCEHMTYDIDNIYKFTLTQN